MLTMYFQPKDQKNFYLKKKRVIIANYLVTMALYFYFKYEKKNFKHKNQRCSGSDKMEYTS
jgi:hypothetical protein